MSRKKTEINPIRAERVKIIMNREKITQTKLAKLIYRTQQTISRIVNLIDPLTEDTAQKIIEVFPNYRIQWLLGYDDFMTYDELDRYYFDRMDTIDDAAFFVLESAYEDICNEQLNENEGIPADGEELLLLKYQLLDFANSLIWNYVNRKNSNVWSYFDTIKVIESREDHGRVHLSDIQSDKIPIIKHWSDPDSES